MNSGLPIGIDQLLSGAVESTRLELKAGWDKNTTAWQIIKSICAFANDFQNLNGGYIVIGVEANNGVAERPVRGISVEDIDDAQIWIRGNCNNITPTYMPVFYVSDVDEKKVLVLWAPASDHRPHQAPDGKKGKKEYWVRVGSQTVVAKDDLMNQLMQQTARVPFDDRRAFDANVSDLRVSLVREFLSDVQSDLHDEPDSDRIFRGMQIVLGANGHTVPRNIGLLFFSDNPAHWFRGARIEVAEYSDDEGGNVLDEKNFKGPIHQQLRQCLQWLENMTTRHLEKQNNVPDTRGWVSYPLPALREALVNAIYHRGYDPSSVEPTKIHLYPNRIDIISSPGPVQGISLADLNGSAAVPPVPARNRRIGEFLKELRLAEARGTGISKIYKSMRDNGSPPPIFKFDEGRTYCCVTLPAHPEYVALASLRDYAYRSTTGDADGALRTLEEIWSSGSRSPAITLTLVQAYARRDNLDAAKALVEQIPTGERFRHAGSFIEYATALIASGRVSEATKVLNQLPTFLRAQEAFDAAIAERRAGRQERAHRYFQSAGDVVLSDNRALLEFAQTKLKLAANIKKQGRSRADSEVRKRLLREAEELLERVLQMDAPPARHAWAWFELGRARFQLRKPRVDIIHALEQAVKILPHEARFREELERQRRQEGQ